MSRHPRKRTIRITLEANDPRDARAFLKAIEHACHQGQEQTPPDNLHQQESDEPVHDPRTYANEKVETEANRQVGRHLKKKAKKIAAENRAAGRAPDVRTPESPEGVVTKRRKFIQWVKTAGALSYRVGMKVLADYTKELIQP